MAAGRKDQNRDTINILINNLNMSQQFSTWISQLPKAELHLHIDGSLQAHRMLSLAKKNGIKLPYKSISEVEDAYCFDNLQSFLNLYYLGASVLIDEDDFYHLMFDYLLKCKEQNIVHTEIMVEPQTYVPNGVDFETMMSGFNRAIKQAKAEWGQSVLLILSLLRHLSEAQALQTLEVARPFKHNFVAIGLASSEVNNPPEKFERLYRTAREQGYLTTAHAGEEGPAEYIWDSLKKLKVDRIDHGVRCLDDKELMVFLKRNQVALTVCPLSNVKLRVYDDMSRHGILTMLSNGLAVTVNSDDPAYFGGYLNENFMALHQSLNLSKEDALTMVKNSFKHSFLNEREKQNYLKELVY